MSAQESFDYRGETITAPSSVADTRTRILETQEAWTRNVRTMAGQLGTAAAKKKARDQWAVEKDRLAKLKAELPTWEPLKPYAVLPVAERERFSQIYFDVLTYQMIQTAKALDEIGPSRGSDETFAAYRAEQETLTAILRNEGPVVPEIEPNSDGSIGRLPTVEVQQVQGDAILCELLIGEEAEKKYPDGVPAWVEGVDPSNVADGARMTVKGAWKVTGTKTYTTVRGASRTVRKIERFDWPK